MSQHAHDPYYIPNKDPNLHYRWISDAPTKLGLWLRSYGSRPGYTLVQGATIEETQKIAEEHGLTAQYVTAANRIAYGQNVLAAIPREEHERRVAEQVAEQRSKLAAAKDAFHAEGDNIPGIRTFEDHPENLDDKRKFAEREDRPFSGQTGVGASPHVSP